MTKDKPKPLLEVGGKPIIEHIIEKIEQVKEINEIFIVTNAKFYQNFVKWLSNFKHIKDVEIINDETTSNEDRLGSLGDVNFVLEKENIQDDLMIIAGDNLFEFPLTELVKFYNRKKISVVALCDVNDKGLAKQYGIVGVNENNRMIAFEEKPAEPKSTLASTGVYIYPPYVLKMLQEFVKKYHNSDKAGNFLEWLHKKENVYCYVTKKRWFDIGSFEQLEEARNYFGAK